jgi:hypothetical protein
MDVRLKPLVVVTLALAAAGCATLPPVIPEAADCRANYLGIDERVERAGARNGGAHRIEGFPYLRSDRFLASFVAEAREGSTFDAWVLRLRQLDLAARASELRNLGWDDPAEELRHLDQCGGEWAARDLADPARRAQLRERVAVPDDYSMLRRTLGVYPVAAIFLDMGIRDFNAQVLADYETPHAALEAPGPLVLWQPSESVAGAPLGRDRPRDALAIPVLEAKDWQALAQAHAPHWLIETAGDHDLIGAPVLDPRPAVDPARPVTYFQPAYTRFGDRVLTQLVYTTWFAERPKSGAMDPYGGALDGIVWRVTLDERGAPLLYDTIHACGCYHYYYVPEGGTLRRKAAGGSMWQEPVLLPQVAPPAPFAIRVQSGTHYVRRLVPLAEVNAARVALYEQAPYDQLLSLVARDGRRSLFRDDGIAEGTERLERIFLWPAGIESPGAMRQWGRHPTSFVGRSHFDEPRMLERLFEVVPDPTLRLNLGTDP